MDTGTIDRVPVVAKLLAASTDTIKKATLF
jgi:hypothetical protein